MTTAELLPKMSSTEQTLSQKMTLEAGLYPELHYNRRLSPMRAKIRQWVLPIIRSEKEILVQIQITLRHPFLDWYFSITSNLGTHTFFMLCLPVLFWFGYASMARGLTLVVAAGVFWSGVIKDMLCLPRPLSPPIERLTMSGTHHLEYGFPSTHTTNAISITLYLLAFVLSIKEMNLAFRLGYITALAVYCFSVVLGRIYCGMHSITDVIGGITLGAGLWWIQWKWQDAIDNFVMSDSWLVPISIITITLFLIYTFPEPVDNCPCFEDCVAFAGVVMGLLPGSWRYANSKYSAPGIERANVPYNYEIIGLANTATRIFVGVAILFLWRMVMKNVLYTTLPPFYRSLRLNIYRKDYLPARDYKNLSPYRIRAFPSVLNLPQMPRHSIGPQSTADVYEQLDAEKENELGLVIRRRGNGKVKLDQGEGRDEKTDVSSDDNTQRGVNEKEGFSDDTKDEKMVSFDDVEEPPLRYDVDVVVKLVVYAGIGWLAVDLIPVLFEISGLGVGVDKNVLLN